MKHYSRIKDLTETQNGLLKTRVELFNEAEPITERLAEIKNNMLALDKTLRLIGHDDDLDMLMPKQQRGWRFDQGELSKAVCFELRHADRPLRAREIGENLLATAGLDPRDKKAADALRKRVSRCMCRLNNKGAVIRSVGEDRGVRWVLRPRKT